MLKHYDGNTTAAMGCCSFITVLIIIQTETPINATMTIQGNSKYNILSMSIVFITQYN